MSTDEPLFTKLPRSKRRTINACNDFSTSFGLLPVEKTILSMTKTGSGYDCGNTLDCIQADGSGYYIVSAQDFTHASCPNSSIGSPFFFGEEVKNKSRGTIQPSTLFLCDFSNTSAKWSLRQNLDWLAQAASTSASVGVPVTYMGEPIPCLSQCPPEDPGLKKIKTREESQALTTLTNNLHVAAAAVAGAISCLCGIACICAIFSYVRSADSDEEESEGSQSSSSLLL